MRMPLPMGTGLSDSNIEAESRMMSGSKLELLDQHAGPKRSCQIDGSSVHFIVGSVLRGTSAVVASAARFTRRFPEILAQYLLAAAGRLSVMHHLIQAVVV